MKITLIGLGTVEGDMSLRAKLALDGAAKILVRSSDMPNLSSLSGYEFTPLDEVFNHSKNYDTINKRLAATVIKAAEESEVCYCVDGSVCEDEACKIILSRHAETLVCDSVSKCFSAMGSAKLKSNQPVCVSAYAIGNLKPCRAAVVYDIDDELVASKVKEKLSYIFGEESFCKFVKGENIKRIKVYEIDRQKNYSPDCAVAVDEAEFLKKERYDYDDLEHIIRLLRAPDGCPWDRVQTSESIKKDMIEEAYELVDAIERGDIDGMEEETGDVLLQAAFHSVLAEEKGDFTGGDVITRLVKKLIFRHSHIFGTDKASGESEALGVWEKNKLQEKHMTTFGESVQAVPKNFPACMRAQKVGKRAAKCGMDFLSSISASESLTDEIKELIDAVLSGDENMIFDEAGDVLFAAVNTCRLAGADCEEALRAATDKFINRFVKFEQLIIADGKDITTLVDSDYDWYWLQAKNALKEQENAEENN